MMTCSIVLSSICGLWLLPGILDESYIPRGLLLIFVSVMLLINIILYICSIIIRMKFINGDHGLFMMSDSAYYLTSIMLGITELFIVNFFYQASSNIMTLNSSTFVDPNYFSAILIYRSILVLLVSFWGIRVSQYFSSFLNLMKEFVDRVSLTSKKR